MAIDADAVLAVVDASGIPPLLCILDSSGSMAKRHAVAAVTQLSHKSRENQTVVGKAGGVHRLVGLIAHIDKETFATQSTKEDVSLCSAAACAIKELSRGSRKNQDAFAEADAFAPLVAMLSAHDTHMQANAATALAHLARGHSANQSAIAKHGAIAALCMIVREGHDEGKAAAATALWALATDHARNKDTIAKLGGVDHLVVLLGTSTTERSQERAAGALNAIAFKHSENRQIVVNRLVQTLLGLSFKATDVAVRVLLTCSALATDCAANQVSGRALSTCRSSALSSVCPLLP